jgi:molecular chaperone DnaK (HSP70)
MTSILIPGVSEQLSYDYMVSYNDPKVKYMFTVVADYGMAMQQFPNCITASKFVDFSLDTSSLHFNDDYKSYRIFINRPDGTMGLLTDEEIAAFVNFENEEDKKETKENSIYRHAFYTDKEIDGFYEKATNLSAINYDTTPEEVIKWAEQHLIEEKIDEFEFKIYELEQELKQSNKKARDIALAWILSMDPIEFQERLIYGVKPEFKLPDFVRAVEGDKDFPDPSRPVRQTNAIFYKQKYSGDDLERSRCNYADANRHLLRFMTEEQFKELCYDDLNAAINSVY